MGRINICASSVQMVLMRPAAPDLRPAARKLSILSKLLMKSGATEFQLVTPEAIMWGTRCAARGPSRAW